MQGKAQTSQELPVWPRALLLFIYGAGALVLTARLYVMWSIGGTAWQQADWLINLADGPVRRGVSGQLFLGLSDITGIGVVALVCAVQAFLVLILFWGVARAILRVGVSERMLLIALSPAFVSFWVYDPHAGFRKELLGFVAFLPLLACVAGRLKPGKALPASFAIFIVAVVFHEVNAFLSLFLMAGFVICLGGLSAKAMIIGWGLALGAVSLAGLAFAVAFPTVSSSVAICDPVLARGASAEICNGIFHWIQYGVSDLRDNANHFAVKGTGWVVLFSYVIISIPVFVLTSSSKDKRHLRLLYLASFLPLLPLYVMSVDWGRWMGLHVTSLTMLSLVALVNYRPDWIYAPIRPIPLAVGLLICGFYGFGHVTPKPMYGVTIEIAKVAMNPSVLRSELREPP